MAVEVASIWKSARAIAGVFFVAASLGGCALIIPQTEEMRAEWPAGVPARAELDRVPFFPQEDYSCGPSALATSLGTLGVAVTPEQLIGQVYLPGRKGSLQAEMLGAPRRYGMVSYELAPRFADLLREIAAGTPVIVLQDYGVWPVPIWHYAVAVGYDRSSGEIILRSGEKRRLVMPLGVLEYTWKETGYWAMVVTPPDRLPATATEEGYLAAVMALERVQPAAGGTAYATLLARWPDNLTAGIGRANALYAGGKLVDAEMVLRHALDRHPDSIAARNNLAQTLSDLGRNSEALVQIERARAAGGADGTSLRVMLEETYAQIKQRLDPVR